MGSRERAFGKGGKIKSLEGDWTIPLSVTFKAEQSDFYQLSQQPIGASDNIRRTLAPVVSGDVLPCLTEVLPKLVGRLNINSLFLFLD